jgi:GT2 family glycosyltransferase
MGAGRPVLSVIVPTHARPAPLAGCLRALADLTFPRDGFELIVVDDDSPVPVDGEVTPFRDRLNVTVLRQPRGGPASARNLGAARARGEFLAFTDDDCAPAPDWLGALAARFAVTPDHMIGGRTINALPGNPYSSASQLLISYLYAYYNAHPGWARFFASNNLAVPARRFRAVGGFDTRFTRTAAEDRELCDRWLLHGYRMSYAPEALVHHGHVLTLGGFWRQHFRYGCGAWRFRLARAQRGPGPVRVEPPAFYVNLLRYPFREGPRCRAPVLASLLVLAQAANLAGYLWERVTFPPHGPRGRSGCR